MTQQNTRRGKTQENKNAVYKSCHSRMSLSAIPTTFNNKKGGDPRLQPSGMTLNLTTAHGFTLRPSSSCSVGMQGIGADPALYPALQACGMTKRSVSGFTLIELLVVILITGILAAVALPQYQKVVRKAQAREVFVAIDALEKALHAHYLETGNLSVYSRTGSDIVGEHLALNIPELKHWRYNTYTFTNSKPQFTSLQTAPNTPDNRRHVWLTPTNIDINYQGSNNGLYVDAAWNPNTGVLESVTCKGNLPFPTCADYFSECPPSKPITTIQVLCGEETTQTSYEHTCQLK